MCYNGTEPCYVEQDSDKNPRDIALNRIAHNNPEVIELLHLAKANGEFAHIRSESYYKDAKIDKLEERLSRETQDTAYWKMEWQANADAYKELFAKYQTLLKKTTKKVAKKAKK